MPSMNRVILMGNLMRDPELCTAGQDTSVCQIAMAINKVRTLALSYLGDAVTNGRTVPVSHPEFVAGVPSVRSLVVGHLDDLFDVIDLRLVSKFGLGRCSWGLRDVDRAG